MVGHESECFGGQARVVIVSPQDIPEAQSTPTDNLMLLYKLSSRMKAVCKQKKGKGLSAVQVGVPWDFFIVSDIPKHIRHNDDPWGAFVGCKYEPVGDSTHESIEGCLSLLDSEGRLRFYRVNRYSTIRVQGHQLVDSPTLALKAIDLVLDLKHDSIVFQHEIDHSRGVLVSDIGKEILLWQ